VPPRTGGLLAIAAVALAAFNLHGLQRLINHPQVRDSFLVPENTVVAAVHDAPAGARVVMLTDDAHNALEQSDYLWYTVGRTGGRPETLTAALTVDPGEAGPIRWVTQGLPETVLLPHLVALVCPGATTRTRAGINEMATVASVQLDTTEQCIAVPPVGLAATYTITDDSGTRSERQIDAVLMAHTIPPSIAWTVFERRADALRIDWRGTLQLPAPATYDLRLDLLNATGSLVAGDRRAEIAGLNEDVWQSTSVQVAADGRPLPIHVALHGQPGWRPSVRLFWTRDKGEAELIPPQALRP
jgi:hypothetical protein